MRSISSGGVAKGSGTSRFADGAFALGPGFRRGDERSKGLIEARGDRVGYRTDSTTLVVGP